MGNACFLLSEKKRVPLLIFSHHPSLITHYVWTSFLCVWMLIRIPKPRQIVTREVPP